MAVCLCSSCGCGLRSPLTDFDVTNGVDFTSLLYSNQYPTEDELASLRGTYANMSQRIRQLDDRVQMLQHELDTAMVMKESLAMSLVDYRLALYPVRRVPEDVWRQIFYHCTDLDAFDRCCTDPTFERSSLDVNTAPWSLSYVCSLWRSIVLSQPKLWSSVAIFTETPTRGQVSLLLSQLGRAREHSLSVSYAVEDAANSFSNPLLTHLISNSKRWRELFLSVNPSAYPVFDRLVDGLPLLQAICITKRNAYTQGITVPRAKFLAGASGLRKIFTTSQIITTLSLPRNIRMWSSITSDKEDGAGTVAEIGNTLRSMPALQKCVFTLRHGEGQATPDITHLNVRELYLLGTKGAHRYAVTYCIQCLTLPSLAALTIRTKELDCNSIVGFLSRSESPLWYLDMKFTDMRNSSSDHWLSDIVAKIPLLKTLKIECPSSSHVVPLLVSLCEMSESTGLAILAPSLEQLTIKLSDSDWPAELASHLLQIRNNLFLLILP